MIVSVTPLRKRRAKKLRVIFCLEDAGKWVTANEKKMRAGQAVWEVCRGRGEEVYR